MKANKNDLHESGRVLSKEEFINKIKTDNEFAKKWGSLGRAYGHQWRKWNGQVDTISGVGCYHDQIANLISELKTNPDSRRLLVSAWNVEDVQNGSMVLPPCHYGFQVYTRELSEAERTFWIMSNRPDQLGSQNYLDGDRKGMKSTNYDSVPTRAISLMWNQRSVDTFLGLPFNIASYGLLLKIIAKEVNMVPDELIGNLGEVHLYLNHIEQAKEQIDREPFELPKLGMDYREGEYDKNLTDFVPDDFYLIDYQSHPAIKAPLSN